MVDFSHLDRLKVSDNKQQEYVIYEVMGTPKLFLMQATEANKPYFNALMKEGQKSFRRMKHAGVTAAAMKDSRNRDRKLFSLYVIKGWSGVKDVDGKEVPFSADACKELLCALPDDVFDNVRDFAGEVSNFRGDFDIEETAKN